MTGSSIWLRVVVAVIVLSSHRADCTEGVLSLRYKIGVDFREGSYEWMSFVAFSPDGTMVASNGGVSGAAGDGLSIWSFPAGTYVRSLRHRPWALSSDWRLMVSEDALIDMSNDRPLFALGRDGTKVAEARFSPDGQHLAFVADKPPDDSHQVIRVVRTADGQVTSRFGRRHTSALAYHPNNVTLASGHWDNVTLWDSLTGRREALLCGFGSYVYGVAFSKDGKLLAAGTDTGDLQIWDVPARKRMHALKIGWGDVSQPAFSPDSTLVAAGTYAGGTLSLVEVSTGQILSQVKVSMFGCGSVAFSPDGRYVITPSNGGQIGPRRFDKGGTIRVFEVTLGRHHGAALGPIPQSHSAEPPQRESAWPGLVSAGR